MSIRSKFAERVLKELGYVIVGNVKYHTHNQAAESGVVCYYSAYKEGLPEKRPTCFVMLGRKVTEMLELKEWHVSYSFGDGILIDY